MAGVPQPRPDPAADPAAARPVAPPAPDAPVDAGDALGAVDAVDAAADAAGPQGAGAAQAGAAGTVAIGAAPRPAPSPLLVEALAAWRARLTQAGLPCRDVAVFGPQPEHELPFAQPLPASLHTQWLAWRSQVRPGATAGVARSAPGPQAELLLVAPLQFADGALGALGVWLAPPQAERHAEQVLLAMGWLQLALAAERLARSQRATRLLDLLGHVASQERARAGAQEWINRTAAWLREDAPQQAPPFGLMLFRLQRDRPHDRPHWWVAADTAWGETASPAILAAGELAAQAALDLQEVLTPGACAIPALDQGRPVAVLVLRAEGPGALPAPLLETLRASLALAEPLLRRWHEAERPLWRHALDALRDAWQRLRGPGHLAWKAGAAGVALALAGLLLWPVPDRVTAQAVIEGRQRQLVSAPFEGFIGQVLVRPGDHVKQGQLLARLDDRDLRLEQARYRSEREQAAGRLRQAMADREAAAQALALAEVQQAEAQLALVEAKLARTQLTAPMDGLVVTGDWVQQIGAPLETGKELFEIASGGGYRVVLHVPDRDIARVRGGQDGALRLAGQPQSVFPFRVAKVTATASVQETVNGFRVEADWVGQPPPLSPGMQGVGKIEVGSANLLTVWTRPSLDWLRLKLWTWWW